MQRFGEGFRGLDGWVNLKSLRRSRYTGHNVAKGWKFISFLFYIVYLRDKKKKERVFKSTIGYKPGYIRLMNQAEKRTSNGQYSRVISYDLVQKLTPASEGMVVVLKLAASLGIYILFCTVQILAALARVRVFQLIDG